MAGTVNGIQIQDMANSLAGSLTTPMGSDALTLTRLGAYQTGSGTESAEVFAYDKVTKNMFVMNNVTDKVEIVSISATAAMTKIGEIDVSAVSGYGGMNSIAVHGNTLAVAVQNANGMTNGVVALYNTTTGALIKTVDVGVLPDMITFSADGSKILVANEGEPVAGVGDPAGSISIIDMSGGAAAATAQTTGFGTFDGQEDALRALGIRITPGTFASLNIEPEYIDLSDDGKTAYVTLQEVNAVGVFDVSGKTAVLKSILPLGYVDFSLPGNAGDFSDRDGAGNSGAISIGNDPIRGMLMPDAIATFTVGGVTYFVTANEGDSRVDGSDEARLKDMDLNNAIFGSNEAILKNDDGAGRLTISKIDGDTDPDTPGLEAIYAFGGRGMSVFRVNADGTIAKVDETGGEFEAIAAALPNAATAFNGENGSGFDSRSDNKAAEPEAVDVANVGGRFFAFVGLERLGGIMTYDVTDPTDIQFVSYMPATSVDYGPEIVKYIAPVDSPTGQGLLLSANEISGSVTAYLVEPKAYTLQLLHFSDAEAGLLAEDTAPIMAALVDRFDDQYANTLILSGGDNYIPGPFINAGTDPSLNTLIGSTAAGRPDVAILNALGVEVSAIGNHEWDLGSSVYADSIRGSGAWVGAQYATVSANLDFSGDSAVKSLVTTGGQDAASVKGKIAPWVTVTEGGEKIGILGATTQVLERISSPSGTEVNGFPKAGEPGDNNVEVDDMDLLAAQLQPIIDQMLASGLNKIILQSHLQNLDNERALATKLHGVDIILAAGSHTRLGDANDVAGTFPGHGADFADTYPITTAGTDGKTTLIINTDNEYSYLGRLVVDFDANGDIILPSLTANTGINGAYASNQQTLEAAYGSDIDKAFAEGSKGDKVRDIADAVSNVIDAKDGTVFGYTDVYLEGERTFVRGEETNFGNLSADANGAFAQKALGADTFIVSLKNGGGIRAQIGTVDPATGEKIGPAANPDAGKEAGGISQLDVENSLRFDNKLMVFDTTAAGLLAILEHGVAAGGNQGRFPQIGGVRFAYDPDLPAGHRITDVALIDENENVLAVLVDDGVVNPFAPSKISVVTLNFTANGGDGYPTKANGENFRYLLTDGTVGPALDEAVDFTVAPNVPANALGEQKAFNDYIAANHATKETAFDEADTPMALDTRIQNLNFRSDSVNDSPTQIGTDGDERFQLTAGDDVVRGSNGIDTAVFANNFAEFKFAFTTQGIVVSGPSGTQDLLTGIEKLEFADRVIDGADSNPLVDDLFYLLSNPDVLAAGLDAEAHYARFGAAEGRDPNAFFDTKGYLATNADVAKAGYDPLSHFINSGAAEGRDPSAKFDAALYLAHNPDVAQSGMTALAHYLQFGQAEGREIYQAIGKTLVNGFDAEYYVLNNRDVAQADIDAYQHYLQYGIKEGRDPNALFDTSAYLEANKDVAAAGVDPVAHYLLYGAAEGRDPSVNFDSSSYLAAYADVAEAGVNPLVHYLTSGIYEGRQTFADGAMS
ncbi:choice-of-anchor I family protein [Xanthobacter sp. DSM 24535]|uniref:choice-of-anchor I family protein n=1 Tax=Roseixanthobacter psychrophilus TaxID=3119917 RepID=UPI003729AB8A